MAAPAERVGFVAFGVAVELVVEHACEADHCEFPDLADGARSYLPPGSTVRPVEPGEATVIEVRCDGTDLRLRQYGEPEQSFSTADECLHALDGAVRSVVAEQAPGLVFVHAGVVGIDGRAVILPGRSMAGKTTLVAALVQAGATYLSDEYAVIDADGMIHPYPRRLSVREPGGRREVDVSEVGGSAADGPLPPALVAAIEFEPDARWSVAPGSGGACAMALVDNAIAARSRSAEVLRAAALVARQVRFVEGRRGTAAEAVDKLFALARVTESDGPLTVST
jgi:hypothetical protein